MDSEAGLEARLRASQLYHRSIIEACPAPLFVVDPGLEITDVNEGSEKLTGVPRKELIGSLLLDRFGVPPRAQDAVLQTVAIHVPDAV